MKDRARNLRYVYTTDEHAIALQKVDPRPSGGVHETNSTYIVDFVAGYFGNVTINGTGAPGVCGVPSMPVGMVKFLYFFQGFR